MSEKPLNIMYIHTHDLGRYVGTHGYAARTPNMDRLAKEGVLFRQAFCIAPTCSPSRAATVTGRYPHEVGMHGLTTHGWMLRDYDEHFGKHFQDHGYLTALTGVQHVTGKTAACLKMLPYDRLIEPIGESAERTHDRNTEVAIDFLREEHDQPFVLNVGYTLTHHSNWDRSFVLSRTGMGPLDTRFQRPLAHLPVNDATRWEGAMQKRATEYFDERLGLLLDEMDAQGLWENTLMVFTTDHGPGLPAVKTNLNDQGLGVVMMMKGPGVFQGGKVVDGLCTHMDLFPTFCEAAGIEKPAGLRGKSLIPMVQDPRVKLYDYVIAEQGYHGHRIPLRAIRTERYRYVRRIGEALPRLKYNADGGQAYETLCNAGYERVMMPKEQLFDLVFDPMEQVNRVDDPAMSDVLEDLRGKLDDHMRSLNDPALQDTVPDAGPLPSWSGARREEIRERVAMWRDKRITIQGKDAEENPALFNAAMEGGMNV